MATMVRVSISTSGSESALNRGTMEDGKRAITLIGGSRSVADNLSRTWKELIDFKRNEKGEADLQVLV